MSLIPPAGSSTHPAGTHVDVFYLCDGCGGTYLRPVFECGHHWCAVCGRVRLP